MLKPFRKNRTINISALKKKMIKFISLLLFLLVLMNILGYYYTTRSTYLEQVQSSNDRIIEQVAISHEMVIKYIRDTIYKTALYDKDLLAVILDFDKSISAMNNVMQKLDNLILFNEFIHSAYLYFQEYDQIYSTSSNNTFTMENFHDKSAFQYINEKRLYNLDPRIVKFNNTERLVISVVALVPLNSRQNNAYLVVNIDAKKSYYDVINKLSTEENMNFYVYNQENTIIIHKDDTRLFEKINPDSSPKTNSSGFFFTTDIQKLRFFTSFYHSDFLDWNFVLETSVNTINVFAKKLYWFFTFSIMIIFIIFTIMIFGIGIYTKPVGILMEKYGESLWKDFLVKNIHIADDIAGQMKKDLLQAADSKFAVLVLQIYSDELTEHDINLHLSGIQDILASEKQNSGIYTKVIRTDREMLSIIISFPGFYSFEQCMKKLPGLSTKVVESVEQDLHPFTYLSVSSVKEHLHQLPLAYRECMEVLKYKLTCRSRLLYFYTVKDRQDTYKYPVDLEKHLINNLLAGNSDACRLLIKKFFKDICNPPLRVEDHEIRSSIYQLQNAVLKSVSGISGHLGIDMDLDISGIYELDIIEIKVMQFIDRITEEIKKKDQYEKRRLYNLVLDYVQNRYMYEDFNLNRAAYDLNINRNHLGRIIKEKTGYNFTEYVNRKRIELAKELLSDKEKNIDDIAKEVGFNYTNYFIKIFRSMEGVTPGQYREAIG